jgi:hypothetical protein
MEVDKEDFFVENKIAGNVQQEISPTIYRVEHELEKGNIRETGNVNIIREDYIDRAGSVIVDKVNR